MDKNFEQSFPTRAASQLHCRLRPYCCNYVNQYSTVVLNSPLPAYVHFSMKNLHNMYTCNEHARLPEFLYILYFISTVIHGYIYIVCMSQVVCINMIYMACIYTCMVYYLPMCMIKLHVHHFDHQSYSYQHATSCILACDHYITTTLLWYIRCRDSVTQKGKGD